MTATPVVSAAEIAASVPEREYLRLLQWPRARALDGDLARLAEGARHWYATHGRPFVAFRRASVVHLASDTVACDTGDVLTGAALVERLRAGEAHGVVALCASAGTEVASEAARLWSGDRPDVAYFLDRFAAAVAERLVFWAAGAVCRDAAHAGETVLPHLSPGCGHWDMAGQHALMALLAGRPSDDEPETESRALGPVRLLPSGALRPQHSVLAALGVTRRAVTSAPEDLCRSCDLDPCAFRRAPFATALVAQEAR